MFFCVVVVENMRIHERIRTSILMVKNRDSHFSTNRAALATSSE